MRRVTFQDWIVERGHDPSRPIEPMHPVNPGQPIEPAELDPAGPIRESVREAMNRLPERDREFVERFYFMGQGYRELASQTGQSCHRLEALHRRAIRQLRKELRRFVRERYGIHSKPNYVCPICRSSRRSEIDRLIATRDPKSTWRPIIRTLKDEFNITISTPQVLIGHEKYH